MRADPDIGPRRRNGQRSDALELGGIPDRPTAGIHVAEAPRFAPPANALCGFVADIEEAFPNPLSVTSERSRSKNVCRTPVCRRITGMEV